jgi:hypothetical protein
VDAPTTVSVEKRERETVVRGEARGIEAEGDSPPIALYTLSEKLEVELLE